MRSAPVAASNSWTLLPTPPSTVMAMASVALRSRQASSETEPNVVSRPLARSRTISVVPGAIVSCAAGDAASPPPSRGPTGASAP